MAPIQVKLTAPGKCHIVHTASGADFATAGSPEFGGPGGSFSATDLLAAALGACLITSIDKVAERGGLDPTQLEMSVTKTLAQNPGRVAALDVVIGHPAGFSAELLPKLERAARSCAVKRSLHPDMAITVRFL